MAGQSFRSTTPIGHVLAENGECSAWSNHRFEQPARRRAAAKLQAVRYDMLHSQVLRQRTHQVFHRLANQDNVGADADQFLSLLHASAFRSRFELVLEVFVTQQVESDPGYAAQNRMYYAGGEFAVRGVEKGAQTGPSGKSAPAPESFGESLGIPGEECHWPDHRQIKKAAFHTPVDRRTGIVV